MKKYFRVEVRIGEKSNYFDSDDSHLYLSLFYTGTGVISIDEHTIEGHISNDYILGAIGEESVAFIIFDFEEEEEMCFKLSIKEENFSVPGRYCLRLHENDNIYAIISIEEKIKNADLTALQNDISRTKEMCSEIFLI